MTTFDKPTRRFFALCVLPVIALAFYLAVFFAPPPVAPKTASEPPAAETPEDIAATTDPLTRIQSADVLIRYRKGSPLRVVYPQDPQDPGRDVAFESLRDVLQEHESGRDFALVLVVSDDSNFIANDFAADRIGLQLQEVGFQRVEVLKFQDHQPDPDPPVIP